MVSGCGGVQGRQRGPPAEELPPDAASTIYVDGLPMDVNKRELAHIFRPFHGYLVSLLGSSRGRVAAASCRWPCFCYMCK